MEAIKKHQIHLYEQMDSVALANALAAAMLEISQLRKELEEARKQVAQPAAPAKIPKAKAPKEPKEPKAPKELKQKRPALSEEDLLKVRSENGKRLAAWRKIQKAIYEELLYAADMNALA
jgi:hypothetical protein